MPFALGAGVGLVGAAATLGGAIIQGNAAESAARTQANAENNATALQLQMFDTTQANLAPYMTSGNNALAALDFGLGIGPNKGGATGAGAYGSLTAPFTAADYQKSPGYNFQFGQGVQAVQNSASAAGGIGGGNTLRALTQFGQGLANTDYYQAMQAYMAQQQQRYGMLSGAANAGQSAAAGQGALSAQVGNSVGNNIVGAGNARAAGTLGAGAAASGGLNSLANLTQLAYLYGPQSYYAQANQMLPGTNAMIGNYLNSYNPSIPMMSASDFPVYCDYALKADIEPYRIDGMSGLPVYKFRYKGESGKRFGYLAHEVEEKYPEAVFEGPRGFLMVDYKMIPSEEDWAELDALEHGVFA